MITLGGHAYIDGRDPEAVPPLTIRRINLWDTPKRKKVVARLKHGTRVKVLGREWDDSKKRFCYQVRSWWRVGWVPEVFLSPNREGAIGDLV